MSFTVRLYDLAKRENSTKRPTGDGTALSCILRRGSSAMTPTMEFDFGPDGNPLNYNYMYIPSFNRYYFIEDWVYIPGMWEAHLVLDVLASHKTEIGATSAYIERSASAYNGDIIDGLYPATTDYDIRHFEHLRNNAAGTASTCN